MARYVVIGTSGSGKTAFARRLSACLRAPHVELDALYWDANWTPRPTDQFEAAVRAATEVERWVVDGNYSVVRDVFWPRATHVVWLNFDRRVVLTRVVVRTLRRSVTRQELWAANRESLRKALLSKDSILLWSFTTFAKNRAKYAKLRSGSAYPNLHWHELRTPAQAEAFLRGMA